MIQYSIIYIMWPIAYWIEFKIRCTKNNCAVTKKAVSVGVKSVGGYKWAPVGKSSGSQKRREEIRFLRDWTPSDTSHEYEWYESLALLLSLFLRVDIGWNHIPATISSFQCPPKGRSAMKSLRMPFGWRSLNAGPRSKRWKLESL